jgi:bla regulator protein blaR1
MIPALANHLWQSTIFAAVAGLLTIALRRHHARARHVLWLAASLKFLVPFSLFLGLGAQVGSRTAPLAVAPQLSRAAEQIAEPAAYSFAGARGGRPAPLLPIWVCGFAMVAVWRWRQWRGARAIVRRATPSPLPFPIPVRSSAGAREPGVYGIFRPVLVLPSGIGEYLSPAQLQAILAHELCHVRRRDNLAAALHMIPEALFWFHPLVWFIGARLVEERERACDEEVVRLGSEPEVYAESILEACKLYLEPPLACVSGVTGGGLKNRIERIMSRRISRNLTLCSRLLLASTALAAVALPVAIGMLRAQEQPSFEVATVKSNHSAGNAAGLRQRAGGGVISNNGSIRMMIQYAYDLRPFQVVGGPSWVDGDRFDINAKATGATPEQVRLMMRRLLADRFKLAVHRETRDLPMYTLVVARGGPKLTAAAGDTTEINGVERRGDGTTTVKFQKVPMAMLARTLARMLQHQVSDGTGLTGEYDFMLRWTPDQAGMDEPGPSIFTALQEQLGLKLESRKGPVEVLVIDHVERTPMEN